jgi:RNA polymerase sigma factor (sigma-70 family)
VRDFASDSSPAVTDPSSHAIDAVLARFERYLRAASHRYRIDDADITELAQDVRIRIWRAQEAGNADPTLAATPERETIRTLPTSYVIKTIASAALDLVRRRRAHRARETVTVLEPSVERALAVEADGPSRVEAGELAATVGRSLAGMLPTRRVVVQLHLAGHERAEIARLLGWTEAKVRNLTYRGLADLREALLQAGVSTERAP